MKKLQKFSARIGALFLFVLLSVLGNFSLCQAEGVIWQGAVATEPTKVKVTWYMRGDASQIRIFRETKNLDTDMWDGRIKVATLKGGAESYVDTVKPDKEYKYEIVAYKKKGKKYKKLDSKSCVAFSGMSRIFWDEDAYSDTVTTSKSICLDVGTGAGIQPSGFEIFRSIDGKKFACIKTVNKKTWLLRYKDKTVQSHQAYYYKVRAFYVNPKKKGKKKYSTFSSVMKFIAINSNATYSVKVLAEEGDALSSLTVCLASKKGNGDFVFSKSAGYFDNENDSVSVVVERYSYDGKKWSVPGDGKIVLRSGKKTYLRLARYDGGKLSYRKGDKAEIGYIYGSYNNLYYKLWIDLKKMTASAVVDGEFYH